MNVYGNSDGYSIVRDYEVEFNLLYKGKVIGFAHLYEGADEIYIENIELSPEWQKKGHGKTYINILKSIPGIKRITGESVYSAINFWNKLKAKFDEKKFNDFIEADDDDEGELVPFVINVY
ncbi:GNAT family N-acetyltransferase [Bacillus toyonensis]|uniref:GNAT family N-acetyltransferase n=1 Tax=Bacillus toyonensis TaxID=155322 RepID=UPI002E1F5CFA|nr:GNAT family N-acetyltransferase [Bacillus toyonensis]MED2737669.1 GNAT family N-acetyltransferase [Bacillus toyonensis]